MILRIIIQLFFLLALFAWPALVKAQAPRPNIVLITLDDADYFDIGAYGAIDTLTPNFDILAAQGMRLTQYYAAPVCSPSRTTALTGRPGSAFGFTMAIGELYPTEEEPPFDADKRGIPAEFEMLPEMLDGYDTAHVGKWHVGLWRPEFRPDYRFDHSIYIRNYFDVEVSVGGGPLEMHEGTYNTTYTAHRAIDYLDTLQEPFFLNVGFMAPHGPFHVPPGFDNACCGFDLDTNRGKYAAMLYVADREIGRIVEHIDAAGLGANTLIVVASDNGGVFHDRPERWLRDGKLSVHEGGIRVPFIARWPGTIPTGTANNSVASSLDIFPTLAELAGACPPDTPGVSLVNVLMQNVEREDYPLIVWELKNRSRYRAGPAVDFAVRDGDWKLVGIDGGLQLFDIATDPGENHDLSGQQPERVEQLYRQYLDWRTETGNLSVEHVGDVIPFETRHDFHDGDFSALAHLEEMGSVVRDGSWRLGIEPNRRVVLRITGDDGTEAILASGVVHPPVTAMFTVTSYRYGENHFQLYVNGNLVDEDYESILSMASNDNNIAVNGGAEVLRLSVMTLQPDEVDWQLPYSVWLPVVNK